MATYQTVDLVVVLIECVRPVLHHTIPYVLHGGRQSLGDPGVLQGADILPQNRYKARSEHPHRPGR